MKNILTILLLATISACSDYDAASAASVLERANFTEIELGDNQAFFTGCRAGGEHRKFTAMSNGKRIEGIVCVGKVYPSKIIIK